MKSAISCPHMAYKYFGFTESANRQNTTFILFRQSRCKYCIITVGTEWSPSSCIHHMSPYLNDFGFPNDLLSVPASLCQTPNAVFAQGRLGKRCGERARMTVDSPKRTRGCENQRLEPTRCHRLPLSQRPRARVSN